MYNNILLPKLMLRELLLIVYNICIFYCITSLLSHPPLSHLLLLAFFLFSLPTVCRAYKNRIRKCCACLNCHHHVERMSCTVTSCQLWVASCQLPQGWGHFCCCCPSTLSLCLCSVSTMRHFEWQDAAENGKSMRCPVSRHVIAVYRFASGHTVWLLKWPKASKIGIAFISYMIL